MATSPLSAEDRRTRRLRRVRTGTSVGAVVCWVVLSLIITIQLTVLQPSWYLSAMDDANAYDRVYTEVLADPALTDFTGDLMGGWPVDSSLVTGNLRTIVPPQTLRLTIESLLQQLTTYLEGKDSGINTNVVLEPLWQSIERVLQRNVASAITNTTEFRSGNAAEFRQNFEGFAVQIASGQRPSFLPSVPLDAATIDSVTQTLVGPMDAANRESYEPQVRVLLGAGDLNGALALVGGYYAKPLADKSILKLQKRAGGDRLDITVPLESMTDESAVQTVTTVRNVWNDRLVPLAWLAGLGGSVCFGFAIWSSIRLGRSWLRRGSLVLVAAGLASAGTWGVLRLALGDRSTRSTRARRFPRAWPP